MNASQVKERMDFLGFENYRSGFLQDNEIIAGVSVTNDQYVAYIVDFRSGDLIARTTYAALSQALAAVNSLKRSMSFTPYANSGCGAGSCGEGSCNPESCAISCAEGCAN